LEPLRCANRKTDPARRFKGSAQISRLYFSVLGWLSVPALPAAGDGREHAGRLEDARADALASLARTQHGPAVVPSREGAGQ
jgi:hypothetical protein